MVAGSARSPLFIQFAREPIPGRVKTRLQPPLDAEQACELHSELVLWTARSLTGAALGDVELHAAGRVDCALFRRCRELGVQRVRAQSGADLGQRMYRAMHAGLQTHSPVILVGSDAPQLDAAYLGAALNALVEADVVLGPALDGGYVLIGARRVEQAWFEHVEWGTDTVFSATVRQLEASGTHWRALLPLQDIDRPEDLPLWRAMSGDNVSGRA